MAGAGDITDTESMPLFLVVASNSAEIFILFILILCTACCWKGYLRNSRALWFGAVHDSVLLGSSNGLAALLLYML